MQCNLVTVSTAWNVSKYEVFFGPNAGKYGPEKTPYLDSFHAMSVIVFCQTHWVILCKICDSYLRNSHSYLHLRRQYHVNTLPTVPKQFLIYELNDPDVVTAITGPF